MKIMILSLLSLLFLSSAALAADVSLIEEEIIVQETYTFKVIVGDNTLYADTTESGLSIYYAEPNNVDYVIETSFAKAALFIAKYPFMGDMEVIGFLHKQFNIPVDVLLDMSLFGVPA